MTIADVADMLRRANEAGRAQERERCRQSIIEAIDPERVDPLMSWKEMMVRLRSIVLRTHAMEHELGIRHIEPSDAKLNTYELRFGQGQPALVSAFEEPTARSLYYTRGTLKRVTMRWAKPGMTPTYQWFNWVADDQ